MTVFGLPLHPLIVHATVVVVPTAALAVLLATFWPKFGRWVSWGPLAAAALAVILVPITTSSGESLQSALPPSELIKTHTELADGLLPWVIVLLVGAAGGYWPRIVARRPSWRDLPRWLALVMMVLVVVGAVGTLVEVVRIGHTGATAAWSGIG